MDTGERAKAVERLLRERGLRIATAESLTGGMLASVIVGVPGASDVFDGGVVTYTNQLKTKLLGVDAELLETRGPIDGDVAVQMALGARELFGSAVTVASTGVAGPAPASGADPGTAYIAVAVEGQDVAVRALRLKGDRLRVRERVVGRALELLEAALRQSAGLT
jgi:PncC family amidohydrolase